MKAPQVTRQKVLRHCEMLRKLFNNPNHLPPFYAMPRTTSHTQSPSVPDSPLDDENSPHIGLNMSKEDLIAVSDSVPSSFKSRSSLSHVIVFRRLLDSTRLGQTHSMKKIRSFVAILPILLMTVRAIATKAMTASYTGQSAKGPDTSHPLTTMAKPWTILRINVKMHLLTA